MSVVVFDFDGTIADSLPLVTELFYDWSGHDRYTDQEAEALRNLPLKKVLIKVGVPLWKLPSLVVKARSEFGKHIGDVPIFDGVGEVIKGLHMAGHSLYLMSSNSQQNVNKFLKQRGIARYFDAVHGNTGLFSKASALKAIVKKYQLDTASCFSIGDETRDIDAAKKVGIKSIAVSWGYNGEEILRKHQPDHMVRKPRQILKLVQ